MTNESKVILGIGALTLAIMGGLIFFSSKNTPPTIANNQINDKTLGISDKSYQTVSSSAKVNLVEFGDYQCPACGTVHPIVKQLLNDYGSKINFVFRNFPLPQHQNALVTAEAAEAAGEQGKFWEMHDKIYENQEQWSESNGALGILTGYAKDLGLDINKFKQGVQSNQFADKINQDQKDGESLGVNSTPTFFLNGQKITGTLSYNDFKNKIEAELAK